MVGKALKDPLEVPGRVRSGISTIMRVPLSTSWITFRNLLKQNGLFTASLLTRSLAPSRGSPSGPAFGVCRSSIPAYAVNADAAEGGCGKCVSWFGCLQRSACYPQYENEKAPLSEDLFVFRSGGRISRPTSCGPPFGPAFGVCRSGIPACAVNAASCVQLLLVAHKQEQPHLAMRLFLLS